MGYVCLLARLRARLLPSEDSMKQHGVQRMPGSQVLCEFRRMIYAEPGQAELAGGIFRRLFAMIIRMQFEG